MYNIMSVSCVHLRDSIFRYYTLKIVTTISLNTFVPVQSCYHIIDHIPYFIYFIYSLFYIFYILHPYNIHFINNSLYLLISKPPSPNSSLWQPVLCFLYLWVYFHFVLFLDSTFKWYHTVFDSLCLSYFTWHDIF